MSKRQWLTVLGVWVIIFQRLGFPSTWREPIAWVTGIIIIAIAYNLPQEKKNSDTNKDSAFVDSNKNIV